MGLVTPKMLVSMLSPGQLPFLHKLASSNEEVVLQNAWKGLSPQAHRMLLTKLYILQREGSENKEFAKLLKFSKEANILTLEKVRIKTRLGAVWKEVLNT